MKILDIGSGVTNGPERAWTEAEVYRMDIDDEMHPDYIHDITKPLPKEVKGQFDIVYCSHILEHISWRDVIGTLKNISEAAKPGGELCIIVPDITWACRQVLEGKYTLGVVGVLYGGQHNKWQYHNTGFTKETLAQMLKAIGWTVTRWKIEQFIVIMNGVREVAEQIVMFAKREQEV